MQTRLEHAQASVKRLEDEAAAIETELPALKDKAEVLEQKLQQEGRDKNVPSAEYAESIRLEFRKSLDLVKVDIAGAQAKSEKLFKERGTLPNEVYAQMSIEQDVELAGLLARKKAMESRLKELQAFFELADELARMQKRIAELNAAKARHTPAHLQAFGQALFRARQEFESVSLGEAKIHPVRPPAPSAATRPEHE
jgi:hypothetical protein